MYIISVMKGSIHPNLKVSHKGNTPFETHYITYGGQIPCICTAYPTDFIKNIMTYNHIPEKYKVICVCSGDVDKT